MNIINNYEKLARETPYLKKQQEFDLLKEYHETKSEDIKRIIICSYLRNVISLAKKYCNGNNLDLLDAIHEGVVGVANAIEKFDINKYKKITNNTGSMFGYFCYRAILMRLKDFYRKNIRQIEVTDVTNTNLVNINKLYKSGRFNDKTENEIVELVCENIKVKEKEAKFLLNLFKPSVELDRNVLDDNPTNNYYAQHYEYKLPIDQSSQYSVIEIPVESVQNSELMGILLENLNKLPETEQRILKLRYGINCNKLKIEQIASKFKLNKMAVFNKIRFIENKLKKMVSAEI